MRFGPLVALSVLILSGCTAPLAQLPGPGAVQSFGACVEQSKAIQFGEGHDHREPAQHQLACNAELVAWDNLREYGWDAESVVGAHAADVRGDLLAVAVNAGETDGGQQGFHLFDIADPTKLTHLGYYEAPVPVGGDRTIAFSADGNTVFLGYEGKSVRPGVAAIDVSDRANPKEIAFWADPQGYGSHTIASGVIAEQQYVFALAIGVNILRYDDSGFTLVGKYATNDQLSILDAPAAQTGAQTYAFRSLYGHDMTFYADPAANGRALLLIAYAYDGLKIVDLAQPSLPVLIGRWMPPADTASKHYTHSVAAERGADGKLILVVGSETFEPENQGIASPLWILDASATVLDATPVGTGLGLGPDPVLLSTWRNPSNAPAGNLGLSVHFFRLEQGLLYVSHYHGGAWAIDLRTDAARAQAVAYGYAMPVPPDAVRAPEECCLGYDLNGAPMVFDVAVKDGIVYAADETQGVVAIKFGMPDSADSL